MIFDSRQYRQQLGFTNQNNAKKFFKATDIIDINWVKIEQYNQRLKVIFTQINQAVHPNVRYEIMDEINIEIDTAYTLMRENNILPRLNNYGRYPEDVYYNWMRGYIVCKYFAPALARIFDVSEMSIKTVGHDCLSDIDTFSQSPVADLEITKNNEIIRLEIQSGYTGTNDIKAHKIREAKRAFREEKIYSYIVHFDLFNGAMAIIDITDIDETSILWVSRAQMEGQRVFSIPDEAFRWFLPDEPLHYLDILY